MESARSGLRTALLMPSLCILLAVSATAVAGADEPYNYKPAKGYIANPQVAAAVGEIILKSIYGDRTINSEKPLSAKLTPDGIWIVHGSRHTMRPHFGGVAEIWISKSDGRIVRVSHGE